VTRLIHSATRGPAAGESWRQLTTDTVVLRDHLDHLRQQGRPLPGDPELVAAAMGCVLATLAYALLSGLRGPALGPDPG
jgi:hypothetical protein